MNILAIDTSSDACSVALKTSAGIEERHVVAPREHTRRLMPMIEDLLQSNDVTLNQLSTIVLGNGPGSFIGMRIAGAVVQGLAFAAGLKIVPVSSLAAIAAETMSIHGQTPVFVAQDARMGEVYLATFRPGSPAVPVAEEAVRLHRIAEPLRVEATQSRLLAAGHAWQLHDELRTIAGGAGLEVVDIRWPRARFLLALGQQEWAAGRAIAPEALEPEYVRQQVASVPAP